MKAAGCRWCGLRTLSRNQSISGVRSGRCCPTTGSALRPGEPYARSAPGSEEASQRGARQALAAIGLGDEHALRDLTELRSLIDAYRAIKRSMLVTFGKAMALAIVSALVAYFWFRP